MLSKDIQSREDIILLVDTFYQKVRQDDLLGPIFNDKVRIDWVKHLPVMYDFWENVVFYTGNYAGNPMRVHQQMHQRFPLTKQDFERWLEYFFQTVDDLFLGDNADLIKQRAQSIATVMELKILHPGSGGLI